MLYYKKIDSIIGTITIVSTETALIALWIQGQSLESKYDLSLCKRQDIPLLIQTETWLKRYFNSEHPDLKELQFHLEGTPFQLVVWKLLCKIPYGQTITYKKLALEVAKIMGKEKMSAQAVGYAVGRNPISIIIPCHRVIGTKGNMVGYNGGIVIKEKLLQLEKIRKGLLRN